MTVSLCMIVKNEENVLARCLDSFKDLADEIVIVDTGSTDRTKEIAARYTDKLYDFAWISDFAAARNFAFSKCSGDYIYSADADELIDAENAAKFKALMEVMEPEVEIVQMWYVNRHGYQTTENYEKDLRPKLFKRQRNFVWIDPIHESVRLEPVVFDSEIEIQHWPEAQHSARDFGVFLKAAAEGRALSGKLLHMYAMELFLSGTYRDFAQAVPVFQNAIYEEQRSADERMDCYCVLARAARLAKDVNAFFKWALKNISLEPCSEVCCELGQYYFDAGDYEEASVWYINALQETEPILQMRAGEKIPLEMLSHCYEKMAGMYPEMAETLLQMAVEYKGRAMESKG
ncbi:MAG: glycosyltransferase [Lachnospiraceae bacterium]|nr:glycosyltransferase [Lachnospiraceae bacterium]